MVDYKEILRLTYMGYSLRQTATSIGHSLHIVIKNSLELVAKHGVEWPISNDVTNDDLENQYKVGYLNKIRSSRALEVEAKRNIELMWLINSFTPDHGTIAGFVQKNKNAFHNTLRSTKTHVHLL